MLNRLKISIIGGGNLGQSILTGLLNFKENEIYITRRQPDKFLNLPYLAKPTSNNRLAIEETDTIFLCTAPKDTKEILQEISPYLKDHTLISCVSGLSIDRIHHLTKIPDLHVVRAIPNTAVLVNQGTIFVSKNIDIITTQLLSNLGYVIPIDEEQIPGATVLGACNIAFIMRYVQSAINAGFEMGIRADLAQEIILSSINGAVKLLSHCPNLEKQIDKVTTPGGCTAVGLNELDKRSFESTIIQGLLASYDHAGE